MKKNIPMKSLMTIDMLDYNLAYIIQDNLNQKIYVSTSMSIVCILYTEEWGLINLDYFPPSSAFFSPVLSLSMWHNVRKSNISRKKTVCMLSDKKIEGAFQNIQ